MAENSTEDLAKTLEEMSEVLKKPIPQGSVLNTTDLYPDNKALFSEASQKAFERSIKSLSFLYALHPEGEEVDHKGRRWTKNPELPHLPVATGLTIFLTNTIDMDEEGNFPDEKKTIEYLAEQVNRLSAAGLVVGALCQLSSIPLLIPVSKEFPFPVLKLEDRRIDTPEQKAINDAFDAQVEEFKKTLPLNQTVTGDATLCGLVIVKKARAYFSFPTVYDAEDAKTLLGPDVLSSEGELKRVIL